jgi:hypothetical protein
VPYLLTGQQSFLVAVKYILDDLPGVIGRANAGCRAIAHTLAAGEALSQVAGKSIGVYHFVKILYKVLPFLTGHSLIPPLIIVLCFIKHSASTVPEKILCKTRL